MLDRLSLLVPSWNDHNAADLGVALVELLAYVADYLSYRQDAVATEAYLETARKRTSVRRHARLVDYKMHNGSNARCWMHVEVNQVTSITKGAQFLIPTPGLGGSVVPDSKDYRDAIAAGVQVFESMEDATLFPELNQMQFYTWGHRKCCLPKGATRATLRNRLTNLQAGMILVFVEQKSPQTGSADDASLMHRHAVRLTRVLVDDVQTGAPLEDPIGGQFDEQPGNAAVQVTEIEWAPEDALPFPICVTSETSEEFNSEYVDDVSIVLETEVQVPSPHLQRIAVSDGANTGFKDTRSHCDRGETLAVPARFRLVLEEVPLTHAMPYDSQKAPGSAHETMHWNPADTVACIILNDGEWQPRYDLLNSGTNKEFAVEVETDGRCFLRFGDGRHGARVEPGTLLKATYRTGNGITGNVGADTITSIVTSDAGIKSVTNPLAARGGAAKESIKHVQENAPHAFRDLKRAVTPGDYEALTNRRVDVQKSVASLRWTGSWHTVFVSVDRTGGQRVDKDFESGLRTYLEKYRLAAQDLEIDDPRCTTRCCAFSVTRIFRMVVAGCCIPIISRLVSRSISVRSMLPRSRCRAWSALM